MDPNFRNERLLALPMLLVRRPTIKLDSTFKEVKAGALSTAGGIAPVMRLKLASRLSRVGMENNETGISPPTLLLKISIFLRQVSNMLNSDGIWKDKYKK